MNRSSLPSTRTMRRAYERYGDAVFTGRVSKHGPHMVKRTSYSAELDRFTHGGRTPAKGYSEKAIGMTLYAGRLKIRSLWLRAGLLAIPYEAGEMRELMISAKAEYDELGTVATDTAIALTAAGQNVDELTQLWGIMGKVDVDLNALEQSAAINSFN